MTVARMTAWMTIAIAVAGCGEEAPPAPAETKGEPAIERTTAQGPLKATVRVAPAKPKVGDVVRLTLTVDADAGAEVTMPPFGEALGRFDVVGFSPREEAHGAGRRHVQDYRLQASRSGRLRIPPLRVEYVTSRPAAGAPATPAPAQAEELLTEEVPVEIESVLTAEGAGSLGAVRGELDEMIARAWLVPVLVGGGVVALGLAFLALRAIRRRRRAEVRRSASEIAFARLGALEGRGLPEGRDAADPWYVELSDIIRRYLEDRYGIRAPELTTEEFLREARRLGALGEPHRALLSAFLEGCDRVKFAGHEPASAESADALGLARRLVQETMVAAAQPSDPPGGAPLAAEAAS
jgi:BatD DUF11 like domain